MDHIRKFHGDFILNTGSPHYIRLVKEVMDLDVYKKGHEIRYSRDFAEEGINVNFVEQQENSNKIRCVPMNVGWKMKRIPVAPV